MLQMNMKCLLLIRAVMTGCNAVNVVRDAAVHVLDDAGSVVVNAIVGDAADVVHLRMTVVIINVVDFVAKLMIMHDTTAYNHQQSQRVRPVHNS